MVAGSLLFMFSDQLFPRQYDWQENYLTDNDGPYGTYVLHELLGEQRQLIDINGPVADALPMNSTKAPASYVVICDYMYLDSLDQDQLLRFVDAGNTVFLSASAPPRTVLDSLQAPYCPDTTFQRPDMVPGQTATLRLTEWDQEHNLTFRNQKYYDSYYWTFFDDRCFCPSFARQLDTLGTCSPGGVNFVQFPYGEGQIFLHTTPLAFTNLSLQEEDGLEYTEYILRHLPGDTVYWDRWSMTTASYNREYASGPRRYGPSPLQYILEQPALAWAWYLLLAAALCYLIFRTRRRQRIIPVIEANRNTSLEFLQTIGRLYFLQNDHKKLALEDMSLLLAFVRNRYRLSTRTLDEAFAKKLSEQAQVPLDIIKKILLLNANIKSSSYVSENTLEELHRYIETFYQHAT